MTDKKLQAYLFVGMIGLSWFGKWYYPIILVGAACVGFAAATVWERRKVRKEAEQLLADLNKFGFGGKSLIMEALKVGGGSTTGLKSEPLDPIIIPDPEPLDIEKLRLHWQKRLNEIHGGGVIVGPAEDNGYGIKSFKVWKDQN